MWLHRSGATGSLLICEDNITDNITDAGTDRQSCSLAKLMIPRFFLPQLAVVDIMGSAAHSRWNAVNTKTKTLDPGLWGDPTRLSWLPLSLLLLPQRVAFLGAETDAARRRPALP